MSDQILESWKTDFLVRDIDGGGGKSTPLLINWLVRLEAFLTWSIVRCELVNAFIHGIQLVACVVCTLTKTRSSLHLIRILEPGAGSVCVLLFESLGWGPRSRLRL